MDYKIDSKKKKKKDKYETCFAKEAMMRQEMGTKNLTNYQGIRWGLAHIGLI